MSKAKNHRRPAPDLVREGIREAILDGTMAEGTQLRQDELAERFGTSRIPVREALRQLEAEGLIRLEPNRGAVVSSFSLAEIIDMLDIRVALECRALRLAVPNLAAEDFLIAKDILDSYNKEPDPASWGDMNWRFHWTLYAGCHRPRLLSLIEANYGHISRFIRTKVSVATGKDRPQREHEQLLAYCEAGDVEAAVSLLASHIEETQKSVWSLHRHKLPS